MLSLPSLANRSTAESRPQTRSLCRFCKNITVNDLRSGYVCPDRRKSSRNCPLCVLLVSSHQNNTLKLEEPILPGLPPLLSKSKSNDWRPVFVMTRQGDVAEDFGIPPVPSLLPGTNSESSLQFIKSCLKECLVNHNCSKSMFQSRHASPATTAQGDGAHEAGDTAEMRQPRRLIDLRAFCGHEGDCKHDVRLVQDLPDCPRYTTLSHCWGDELSVGTKTMKNNLLDRKSSIPLDELSKNFGDAISITRRLGIGYLWIDALCIIQDSEEDWAQESVKMGYIYDGSYLTIAASSSRDGTGGCYYDDAKPQDKLGGGTLIEISSTFESGQSTNLILWAPRLTTDEPLKEPIPLVGCPLSQRGWAFQEWILSPRTIHFTRHQLVWECRDLYETEDRLPFVTARETLSLSMTRRISSKNMKTIWYDWLLGSDYSSRKFTRMEDRLIAIAGIARSLHQRTNDLYIAGLWKNHLGCGLAWRETAKPGAEHHQSQSSSPRRRPTWTWASTDREFEYPWREFAEDEGLRYCSSSMQTIGGVDDPFAVVIGGSLVIEGSVHRGRANHFDQLHLDWPYKEQELGSLGLEFVDSEDEFSEEESSWIDWSLESMRDRALRTVRATNPLGWYRRGERTPDEPRVVYIRLGRYLRGGGRSDEVWLVARQTGMEEEEYERIGIAYRSRVIHDSIDGGRGYMGMFKSVIKLI